MVHVVVIDDSKEIRDLLAIKLGRAGFDVHCASSATAGLDLVLHHRPHVVLLDLEMPQRDGVACLCDIRANPLVNWTPVIMVSATPARDVILRVAQVGVQGIILKDQNMSEAIVKRIEQLLGPAIASPPAEIPLARARPPALSAHPSPARRMAPPMSAKPVTLAPEEDAESIAAGMLQLDADTIDIEKAAEELRRLKPLMTRTELLDRILSSADLRAIKPAVQQVLSLTGSAGASLDAISKAIKQDQALSLKVLKIANSPLYTRGERVDSVQKAVARIGVAQIRETVMSLAVIERFGSAGLAGRIRADWFWEHSIAVGLIAARIARLRNKSADAADALFTAGLLHDVGRVIYAEQLGETYEHVIATADRLDLPLETVESRLLLINHADLTDRLLRQWRFAAELINPIALHHLSVGNIRRTCPRMGEEVATLGLANRLAHALLLGCSGNESVYPIEEFVEFLGLSAEHIRSICAEVPDQTIEMRLQMLCHGAEAGATILDDTRQALAVELRPLAITARPGIDTVGILLSRLCPSSTAEAPNIAIVRVNDVRERTMLLTRLRDAEAAAGVKDLPTLVVGAGPKSLYAEGMLGARRACQVVTPIRLGRLIRALRDLAAAPIPQRAAA